MQDDSIGDAERMAASERENARRAAVAVVGVVGSMLIFRMTGTIDTLFSAPSPVIYGTAGALFGAICGAVQRADELEDRVMHALMGAVILGVVFGLFSLDRPTGPCKYRFC